MTDLETLLTEIEKRASAATKGPWGKNYYGRESCPDGYSVESEDRFICDTKHQTNAEFISHARTDVPLLLALVRKLVEQRYSRCTSLEHHDEWKERLDAELLAIAKGEGE